VSSEPASCRCTAPAPGGPSLPPTRGLAPGRLRRLEFDARYVPSSNSPPPLLARLWCPRCRCSSHTSRLLWSLPRAQREGFALVPCGNTCFCQVCESWVGSVTLFDVRKLEFHVWRCVSDPVFIHLYWTTICDGRRRTDGHRPYRVASCGRNGEAEYTARYRSLMALYSKWLQLPARNPQIRRHDVWCSILHSTFTWYRCTNTNRGYIIFAAMFPIYSPTSIDRTAHKLYCDMFLDWLVSRWSKYHN